MPALECDFLGDGKIVVFGVLPVDQPDRLVLLTGPGLDLYPVAQQAVYLAVGIIQTAAFAQCRCLVERTPCPPDQRLLNAAPFQPPAQQGFLDIAVALAVVPVAQIPVAEPVPEQAHHPLLGHPFDLADGAHKFSPCFRKY